MRQLRIDSLNITLKGVSPEMARAAASGLGLEIMKHLEKEAVSSPVGHVEHLDAGQIKPGKTAAQLRSGMAAAIVGALRGNEKKGNNGGGG